jgi:hypothetical protein
MRLVLHPKVYSDIDEIMGYYERIASSAITGDVHRWYQAPVMSRRRGAAFPHARNGD